MRQLWRLVLWGVAAAAALALAVIVSRSEVGAQRVTLAIASLTGRPPAQAAKRAFDAEAEVRRLSEDVRRLAGDRDRLTIRLAAIEQNLDDVTGSVKRQLEATQAGAAPWPADDTPAPTRPETIAATLAPMLPPTGLPLAAPSAPAAPPTGLPLAAPSAPASRPAAGPLEATTARAEYGVDIGSAQTIEALRVRWLSIRAAHAQLFKGLWPIVSANDVPKYNHVELRLVVGPFADAEAAARLCASLAPWHIPCHPAVFDGQRLALR
jgi:hypothetical protein